VDDVDFLEPQYNLKPNFWRAPTDNDYGADFQKSLIDWKRATYGGFYLLNYGVVEKRPEYVELQMKYDMPDVFALLILTYKINGAGAMKVTQKMNVNHDKDISILPKFGMQMVLKPIFKNLK